MEINSSEEIKNFLEIIINASSLHFTIQLWWIAIEIIAPNVAYYFDVVIWFFYQLL